MRATRTSSTRRSLPFGRRVLVALTVGAGVALTPLPALADAATPMSAPASVEAAAPTRAAQVAVDTALAQLGDPYVWAGAGPDVFDCSGLTQFAYRAAGINLPHNSRMQSRLGATVSKSALRPGDLVFFYSPISHVAMYIGNGKVVQAPQKGDVVKISNLAAMRGYVAARRVA
jgi:cell wall-associated NlpC family hydrolase